MTIYSDGGNPVTIPGTMTAMTTSHLRRLAVAAAASGALAVTAACTGNPEPRTTSTATSSTTPTASATPSPTTPTPTPTPTQDLEAQLLSATNRFYSEISKAYQTLDIRPVEALLTPGSDAASGYTDYIKDAKSKGHSFRKVPNYRVSSFTLASANVNDNTREAVFTQYASGLTEVDQGGQVVTSLESESGKTRIVFMKVGDQWLVERQDIIS
ncbi:TcaA NTF2-like domain-containing protein [Actinopolymorpha alba]|uniref:TcaA NTF2-like domain-containing protein n=1 Tax=Actinopolymorpha alba TaxID=533267 RepID=UPI000A034B31|nr:hypothetical protein [Actinopolymorpha alba]